MKSAAVCEVVPKEQATVETFGAMKKWYGSQHLAIRHHGQPKKQTQGKGESQKKLTAACRGMTCQAGVAQRKGCSHKGLMVEQRQQKNGPGTMSCKKPGKDGHSGTDIGRNQNATKV
jgi:hypothetical protein